MAKGKTKRALADEAYHRVFGDTIPMFETPPAEPVPAGERLIRAPEHCPGCRVHTAPSSIVRTGRWQAMRAGLAEHEGWLQCTACSHIVRVTRVEWERVQLIAKRALTDTPHGQPKPGREHKFDRGAG